MKFLAVFVVAAAVPLLIAGMAFHGARIYSSGEIRAMDVVGFGLQVLIIAAAVLVGVVLWKSSNRQSRK